MDMDLNLHPADFQLFDGFGFDNLVLNFLPCLAHANCGVSTQFTIKRRHVAYKNAYRILPYIPS